MFPLNSTINITSLKIWLQTQPYVRVPSLPDLDNVDYVHVSSACVQEPFILNTDSFKLGSIVLVRDPNSTLWDIYKLTIQGNILKYSNLVADKYWYSIVNGLGYNTNFIESFINNFKDIQKLPLVKQCKLFGDLKCAVDRTVDINKRNTYMVHYVDMLHTLLIKLHLDGVEYPVKLKKVAHIFSAKTLLDKLYDCPWLDEKTAKSIVLTLESNTDIFKAHIDLVNSRPNIGQHLFGTIDGISYVLSDNFIYQYSKKSNKKMRLFSLL